MATQDLAAVVREIQEAWNAKDLDRCASYAHPDARITNMASGAQMTYREYIEGWARAFPDGKIETTSSVVQGDDVVTEFTGRGTHTGTLKMPSGDLPPTGRRLELRCIECYRFRNGKIAEGRMYFDSFSMFQQLGVGAPAQGRSATQEQTARPH